MKTTSSAKDKAKSARAQIRKYHAALSPESRRGAAKLRDTIRAAAPDAVEGFSYGMPGFRFDGRTLVWYAAWKEHYSLYPLTPGIRTALGSELDSYETSKGTIRLPMTKRIPVTLVKRLVKARISELRKKAKK